RPGPSKVFDTSARCRRCLTPSRGRSRAGPELSRVAPSKVFDTFVVDRRARRRCLTPSSSIAISAPCGRGGESAHMSSQALYGQVTHELEFSGSKLRREQNCRVRPLVLRTGRRCGGWFEHLLVPTSSPRFGGQDVPPTGGQEPWESSP